MHLGFPDFEHAPLTRGCACSSVRTPFRGASGIVGMGAYSIGSKMPTVL
jgi:hypothetical protein